MIVNTEKVVTEKVKEQFEIETPSRFFIVALQLSGQVKSVVATSLQAVNESYPGAKVLSVCAYVQRHFSDASWVRHNYFNSDATIHKCVEMDLIVE